MSATITARIEIDETAVHDLRTARHALWAVGIVEVDEIATTLTPGEFEATLYDAEPGDVVEGDSFNATVHRDTDDRETFVSVYVTYAPTTPERIY